MSGQAICQLLAWPHRRDSAIAFFKSERPTHFSALELHMFAHNKRLQYTVRVSESNPGLANLMLEQFGGPVNPIWLTAVTWISGLNAWLLVQLVIG